MSGKAALHLGCAGWSLSRAYLAAFPEQGSHLQRYAATLPAVEINTSFYRPHKPETYRRWADAVPEHFRFSVKVPREITHIQGLVECESLLQAFLDECGELGDRLGCLLVQLPPSLAFVPGEAGRFLRALRQRYIGGVALEPRHPSWLQAAPLLADLHIAQVAADPARIGADSLPGGWTGLQYWRLHGSPRIYYSDYGPEFIQRLGNQLCQSLEAGIPTWCIFDNTAAGAALGNALQVQAGLATA
ncbi:hypothetical protein PS627_04020 [Pseudomonas fluorescens]|uniref:DUF72 domain-containing protein n=1 Tax=Pseudomonas fluorescens TaxID=294 RepID=UPI001255A55F|nr:DUF72 domain-containing protein [Pseudomonas fluorescens]CAG8870512.1 hypothetical protein PS627_04020 [Pseudomonas fluorescens]VVP69216.1 hypothetical protein PS910_00540 [Pseudomonas fluorescens]